MTESRCANNLDVVEDALGESMGDSGNGGDEPCGLDLPHGLNCLRHIFHAC